MSDCIPSFPQDLIIDILVRLPVKSIGRFRCVSKPWRSLLSDPLFIKLHRAYHLHDPESLILTDSYAPDNFPLVITFAPDSTSENIYNGVTRKIISPLLQEKDNWQLNKWAKSMWPLKKWTNDKRKQIEWIEVIGSCHGLVLLINEKHTKFLMNPITLEGVKIPKFSLSLDPSGHLIVHGLGYDGTNDDYKVVTLSIRFRDVSSDDGRTVVDIYSVKTKTWKRSANSHYYPLGMSRDSGVFVNGCVHWLARDERGSCYDPFIAGFDLAQEKFQKVPHPKVFDDSFLCGDLTVIGGCLTLIVYIDHDKFGIWMMKDYGLQDSWTKFTILNGYMCSVSVACQLKDDEFVLVKNDKMVVHTLSNGSRRDMEVADAPSLYGYRKTAFKESLLSPNYKPD
ncbi:OLC1v1020418C1 [Oldenlandia corymbosa var. corymbosa]|uniref:OLC1v1020418C1 n=1 Tax=Oldenlandia corymbosa var. corymbosa TaxID=529605 RepID=A0AAV1EGC6_OLDCO|nr:OLC1v1020418C1 [Oldenlandia corymbosa var. corymbosa]